MLPVKGQRVKGQSVTPSQGHPHETKTEVDVAVVGLVAKAVSRPRVPGGVAPATAPPGIHAIRLKDRRLERFIGLLGEEKL